MGDFFFKFVGIWDGFFFYRRGNSSHDHELSLNKHHVGQENERYLTYEDWETEDLRINQHC